MPRPPQTPNNLQSLHPTLKAALGSLDVQLEDELARYRKQRRAVPVMAASRIGQIPPKQPLEVVNLQLPASPLEAVDQSPALPSGEGKPGAKSLPTSNLPPNALGLSPARDPQNNSSQENGIQNTPVPPENYLESSEQLLKSLGENPPASPAPEETEASSVADNLLTPLGMGSMLLLLLSSASIGYLLFNPAIVQRLGLNRFFPGAKPEAVVQTAPSPIASNPSIAPPSLSPNLANGGVENLDKNSIANLKPSENSTRTPIPSVPSLANSASPGGRVTPGKTNPAIVSGSPDLAGQLGLPPIATPLASPPAAATAKPLPSPARTNPVTTPAAATPAATNRRRDTYFYVVVAYDGDRSLAQARTIIPEAYLAEIPDQGTKIQMGAFLAEPEAKALVQELKQRGVTATIYQPN